MSDLIKNITQRMQTKDWNAYDLAKASGVPQSTIHRLLSGKHADPRTSTIKKLAAGLGTTEIELRKEAQDTALKHKEYYGKTAEIESQYIINIPTRLPLIKWANIDILLDSINEQKELEVMPTSKIKVSSQAFMVEFNSDIYADYINNGDFAIIDPKAEPTQGGGVLIVINKRHHIMIYEKIDKEYLHAIKGSKTISMTDQHDYKMIGHVVWIVPAGRKG